MTNKYKNKVVVFIDILGFKNMIERKTCKEIKDILSIVRQELGKWNRRKGIGYKCMHFSDSSILSFDLDDSGENIVEIVLALSRLQFVLSAQGVLIRGGMCIGEIFHDNYYVFGSAVNEAYRIESTVSNLPRIIATKEIVDKFDKFYIDEKTLKCPTLENYFEKDDDGFFALKYLEDIGDIQKFKNEYSKQYEECMDRNTKEKYRYIVEKLKRQKGDSK
jgi:hypothetical protein